MHSRPALSATNPIAVDRSVAGPQTPSANNSPASPAAFAAASSLPGHGYLCFSRVAERSVVTRCRNTAPLKLLTPDRAGPAAWAYASTFGGGLVAGDHIRLDLDVESSTIAVATTQASTKIFHQHEDHGATQELIASVADDAVLLVLPDPLTCFADAVYTQAQSFDLAETGSLLLLDWLTNGRTASGERWAFRSYDSLNTVSVAGREIIFDRTKLGKQLITAHPLCSVGDYQVLANLFLIGPAMRDGVAALEDWIKTQPIQDRHGWIAGFSPADWGGVLRIAGRDVQTVTDLLRGQLRFIHPLTGGCPWSRKW